MSHFTDIREARIPSGPLGAPQYLGWVAHPEEPEWRHKFVAAVYRIGLKNNGIQPKRQPKELIAAAPGGPMRLTEIVSHGVDRIWDHRIRAAHDAINMLFFSLDEEGCVDRGLRTFPEAELWYWKLLSPVEHEKELNPGTLTRHWDAGDARRHVMQPSRCVLPMTLALMFRGDTLATMLRRARDGQSPDEGDVTPDGPLFDEPGPDRHPRSRQAGQVLADIGWVDEAIVAARDLAAPMASPLLNPSDPIYLPRRIP